MRERSNIINVISRHIDRVLPKNWWKRIKDLRSSANLEWNLGYIMEVLMAGALSGCKTLREIETLSELYAEKVPDTTLHDVMIRLNPEGLRTELANGVKQALREHELPKEEFPVRITAIDGKYNFNTSMPVNEYSEPIGGGGNNEQYRHLALRAMYVSSAVKLYLGQYEIPSKASETKNLISFIDELRADYGRTELLEVISVDAGIVSKKNAGGLIDRGLGYILALKGSQPMLSLVAHELFANAQSQHVAVEIYNGKQVTRTLFRAVPPRVDGWEHLQEIWKIITVSEDPKSGKLFEDVRYFMTSLKPSVLGHSQVLDAVRMHWGIENNANWCFDVLWKEDSAPWTSRAMELVSFLRMMAYNIIQRLKMRRLKSHQNRALGWKDLFRYFEHALCALRQLTEAQGTAVPAFSKPPSLVVRNFSRLAAKKI